MKDFRIGERVYYKFDDSHPYESQAWNDSTIYGKGRVCRFVENNRIAVFTDTGHRGLTPDDTLMIFKPEELQTVKEYYGEHNDTDSNK